MQKPKFVFQMSHVASIKLDSNQVPYIDLGKNFAIRLQREAPEDWALEKAKLELRESDEVRDKAMQELKLLIQSKSILGVINFMSL